MATTWRPSSPSKRLKALVTSVPNPSETKEEDHNGNESATNTNCCGICLWEGGGRGSSRGYIDSCDHYFCFVCIMEWAKVESKCPLCKRRFTTIHRPPKPPFFSSHRLVHVPLRDQVYYLSGNATIGPPDLYSEVKCSVCCSVADESLTLLCDLCDSAAHTYCVGLGVTVPEGDWFCEDCTLLRDEHENTACFSGSEIGSNTLGKLSSTKGYVSISDIVREPYEDVVLRTRGSTVDQLHLPPPSNTDSDTNITNNNNSLSSKRQQNVGECTTKSNARTLMLCRSVLHRIRVLRENWDRLQSGTLCFSSVQDDRSICTQKSVTFLSRQQQSAAQCLSSNIGDEREPHETLKAWKMMDKARSIELDSAKGSRRKLDARRKTDNVIYRCTSPNNIQNVRNERPGHHYHSVFAKQKRRKPLTEAPENCCEGSGEEHSLRQQRSESVQGPQNPPDLHNNILRSQEKEVIGQTRIPARIISSNVPEREDSNIIHVAEVDVTTSSKPEVKQPKETSHLTSARSKEKKNLMKISDGSKQYNDAKIEIQSLVKLNLKLQMKKRKLEIDSFKEVAWLATHSILAACGLEDSRSGSSYLPGSICSHPKEAWRPQMSSLMPDSCRECFYVFVKDTVNAVVWQKTEAGKT